MQAVVVRANAAWPMIRVLDTAMVMVMVVRIQVLDTAMAEMVAAEVVMVTEVIRALEGVAMEGVAQLRRRKHRLRRNRAAAKPSRGFTSAKEARD